MLRDIIFHRIKMRRKQNKPAPWKPWCTTMLLLLFALFTPSAHAIGPYRDGDKTVVDQGTGLEWQKADGGTMHIWQNAVEHCETLSLAGKSDWRVPNIRELKSLVDYNRSYPAIDPAIPCQSSSYWSSTTVADDTSTSIWVVFFANGDDIWKPATENASVRCVRTEFSRQ